MRMRACAVAPIAVSQCWYGMYSLCVPLVSRSALFPILLCIIAPEMAYFYYATSQKPTAVTHAAVGAFTGPDDLNLVLGKTGRLDLYTVTDDGPQTVLETGINGRIATMKVVRLTVRTQRAPV